MRSVLFATCPSRSCFRNYSPYSRRGPAIFLIWPAIWRRVLRLCRASRPQLLFFVNCFFFFLARVASRVSLNYDVALECSLNGGLMIIYCGSRTTLRNREANRSPSTCGVWSDTIPIDLSVCKRASALDAPRSSLHRILGLCLNRYKIQVVRE